MNEKERMLIENNMKTIEIRAKYLYKKYALPQEEYDEFFQVACMFVCDRIHKYNGTAGFSTFVDCILKNAFIDRLRVMNKKRIEPISLDECCVEDEDGNVAALANFLKTENNTENEVLVAITRDTVKKHIAKARERCTSKTTVKGFYALELKLEGYTGVEIAKMFNAPSNSVRMWITRAKKTLVNDKGFAELLKTY